jgi:ectoine hydroxylase-related dioxygenase (phytanoyl-CoA dioxygenase family)
MRFNSFKTAFDLKDQIDSTTFNNDIFQETGVFVLRNVVPKDIITGWQQEWETFYNEKLEDNRDVHQANPVALKEQLPESLANMYKEPCLLDIAKIIHGESVALYNHRFVIKDKFSLKEVFLHQDSCYHLGFLNKCSFFVPLSYSGPSNGSLSFHLGSHKYGYLGDAGEINRDAFDIKWPIVTPELYPGDIAIMNSSVWHESGPSDGKINRIVADIHYQPANDPTGKELLSGEWLTDFHYSMEDPTKYFKSSRILKLKNK